MKHDPGSPFEHSTRNILKALGCSAFGVGCSMFPNFWNCARILILCLFALTAHAHIGSPDIFFDGAAGPYPVRVTVRMPGVVPGRAEISARVLTSDPVEVSFLPIFFRTSVTNTPPAEIAQLVRGETNLYSGELWLMSFGGYSVEVRVKGPGGDGTVEIPVNSIATRQLPLPAVLGKILFILLLVLVIGGIGIAAAAGREAALPAGATAGKGQRWKGFFAAATATVVFVLTLYVGKNWWASEERGFQYHLREGAWPDLTTAIRTEGADRILQLEIGKEFFQHNSRAPLIPDHGKLMHLFLIRDGSRDAFAHLHPIRKKDYTFEVALPPLPEGRYDIFCDLTFEGGVSSTATNAIVLPPVPTAETAASPIERDPDDSWATTATAANSPTNTAPIYQMPDGTQIIWQSHPPLRMNQDAALRFSVVDTNGAPLALQPYMGMLCHAAVLRSDNGVFAHLHPAGNFSMAAQTFFAGKMTQPNDSAMPDMPNMPGMDHSMHHMQMSSPESTVSLPYQFPAPGNYRIWVQFKIGERVLTGVFDAQVGS
jgi:hypothetical protein